MCCTNPSISSWLANRNLVVGEGRNNAIFDLILRRVGLFEDGDTTPMGLPFWLSSVFPG
jgi:hypothetical protein